MKTGTAVTSIFLISPAIVIMNMTTEVTGLNVLPAGMDEVWPCRSVSLIIIPERMR